MDGLDDLTLAVLNKNNLNWFLYDYIEEDALETF